MEPVARIRRRPPVGVNLFRDDIECPIGTIVLVTNDVALCGSYFADQPERTERVLRKQHGDATLVARRERLGLRERFEAYFAGDLAALNDIPVEANGSAFQNAVWSALRKIPAGTTTSYGALAASLGMPSAMRAVGLANGANPVGIVVPCHRVIGANGTLTGYGGGLERKAWLLAHEGVKLARGDSERQIPLI
jgi:methylated-DNA-[protein]-cysteine S-methyltransferase